PTLRTLPTLPTVRPSDIGHRSSDAGFCGYLVIVAAFSLVGYLAGRCGVIDFYTMRYELLSPLGAAGLAGAYLRGERSRRLRRIWAACAAAVFAVAILAHARLAAE